MSLDGASIIEEMQDALANVFSKHEKSLTTKWLVVTEVIDESGAYGLWTLGSREVKPWDVLGMLSHALSIQQGEVMFGGSELDAGDDDEEPA